ncbi:MAG: CarD family transcriptional regulator [Actinomycetota bacterium]|nr:CarD family transcriptional regulator [Actinomycetota bacterium]
MAGTKDGANNGERLTFNEGDLVVYPNHGAGCIAGVEEKTVLGEVRRYYVVHIPESGLTLSIPADGDNGLRHCADKKDISGALDILRTAATEMPSNWNHRLKHNQEKLREGGIAQVAEVVRNLSVYGDEHGLSTGERNMFMKARQILISEIALVRGMEAGEVESLIDGALRDGAGK